MEGLNHWINGAKEAILDTFALLSYIDLLIFAGCFLVFVLLYFLSCIFARMRFFVPHFLKLCAYIVLLATPFVLLWVNQNILYKSEVEYAMAKRLEYSPSFYVDARIYNRGKLKISRCYFMLDVLRESSTFKNKILNFLTPYKRYKYEILQEIEVGQSQTFQKTINNFPYKIFEMSLSCYGG